MRKMLWLRELCSFMSVTQCNIRGSWVRVKTVWHNVKIIALYISYVWFKMWSIILVTATWRLDFPSSITSMTSSGLDTKRSVQPWQWNSIKRHKTSRKCLLHAWWLKNTVLYCVLAFLPWQMAPCSYLHGQPGWFWKL